MRKVFLFTGLFFILIAGIAFWTGLPPIAYQGLLGAGIFFKILFLFNTFRSPGFKMSLGMYLILIGVALILLSMVFKKVYPLPLLRNILFYTAIPLKVTGVVLLFKPFPKKK